MKRRLDIRLVLWIIALLSGETVAIQYTPIEIDDLTDCALILTNSRQYTANLLQSDFGGPVNCITYDAINQAYSDARKRIDIPAIEDDWRPEEVAAVGQVMLDVSQQIAKEFDLNREDIEVGLPRVDVTKTAIKEICPAYLSTISCRAGKYRRHDGLCNNIQHPAWGAAMTTFSRLLPPQFSDDISSPRISQSGKSLPPARVVSRTIHVDEGYHDHAGTVMLIAWGQFMDHDFTLMGTPLDSRNRNEPEECCYRPEHLKNPYCMEIDIPEDDYFYRKFNVRCQDFVRAFPGVQSNCRLGSRTPFNTLTAVIDGNTVYGVTEQFSRQLRAGHGGLLRMNPAFAQFDLKELLPMKTDIPDEGCVRTNHSQFCFLAGEIRVNEQLVLTCIHTLMAREHNRIAKELAELNPHWNDEILYQEARRITIAEIQHVSFNEFLPLILGKDMMEKFGLLLTPKGYWNGYNAETNPAILDAFSAAAFRFGHSLLPSAIERWSKAHKFIASKRLSELIRRPYDLYRAGVIDEYFTGLLNQVAQAMDDSVTQEVTNNLLKKPGNRFGLDLVSFNIQRGRDFGLPGYMYFRKHCGLQTADSFNEMFGSMPNSTIYRYMTIYESPWDIDLWSGGAAEKPLPGSMVGPTFACIIASQMSRIRQGDRFWYELPNQPSSFTAEQLQEIKKVKLSRILCDNTDLIDSVQIYAMVLPDHDINPRVPCRSSVLPRLDLSHWRDIATKSFIDNGEIHTSFEVPDAPVNRTASPSAYEYHIKTVAIIEGSSPSINVNDILNAAEQDARDEHRVSKRSVNAAGNTTGRSDDADVVSSHRHDNVTASNSTSTLSKDLTKRSYHAGGAIGYHRKAGSQAEMTQAIMEENPSPKIDASYRRSASASDDEGDHDIEDFFRKNVPIYDGVPIARRGFHRAPFASQKHHFLPQDEEEEEEEAPLNELLEVHPGLDAEHEFVPMKVDEFGKQKVMENEAEDEEEDQPSYPYPSKYHQSSYSDEDAGFYHKPAAHPYPFENTHSSFKSHNHDHSSFSDNRSPPRFGTSHQFNSFADQQPRYYKHFRPSIPYPAYEETEDPPPYSPPAYSYPTPARPVEYPRTPYTSGGHDFVPKRAPPLRGSYASKYPARTTHVPQTLEEYHRIHGTFDTYQNPAPTQRPYRPIIVPQDDKEDDEEEKDADPSQGPKSFVSLNFGTGVGSDDEGVSIRHQIGHIKPKSAYFGNSYEDREIPVEYPPETVPEGSAKYEESPGTIRSFVDSVFKHNDYDADIVVGKKSNLVSPYNPHFGERVKSKGPAQNILWHRKASDTRVARDKQSRDKNDRLIHEENIKLYDNLVKEVTMKPAKRDVNDRSNESEEAPAEDEPETASQEAQPDEDEESPQETEPARKQADAEDEPKLTYWSHSTSEPN